LQNLPMRMVDKWGVAVREEPTMDSNSFVQMLRDTKEWFDRSTRCLVEDDSTFAPFDGAMTTAQVVAHVAQTVDWFMEGASRPEGFDLDFERMGAEVAAVDSLTDARAWVDRAFGSAIERTQGLSPMELVTALPDGPVMGGAPRLAIYQDHTAHHRGALTVYARLRGHTPAMPYGDM
jgi:uncharacterized damage-inducible protein DinB